MLALRIITTFNQKLQTSTVIQATTQHFLPFPHPSKRTLKPPPAPADAAPAPASNTDPYG